MTGLDLSQLVGQEEARGRLVRWFSSGRLPHALVFEGPDGVGKRTAARMFAAARLCLSPPEPARACGVCAACTKLLAGTHADFTDLSPKGRSIKVSEVREVERGLRLRPLEGRAKVVVVDQADRMTIEAQNALLKSLEEPPGQAHWVLVTQRPRTLLPTILSRCQRLRFRPIPVAELAAHLQRQGLPDRPARLVAGWTQGAIGRASEMDADSVLTLRDEVRDLDVRLEPGNGSEDGSVSVALSVASDLAQDRARMKTILELWALWLQDQLRLHFHAMPAELANEDQRPMLQGLVARRSTGLLLHRARTVLEAHHQLDLPFNLNALMVAEQMCLALAGRGRMVLERP
ncbi:MAG: DNA polymerase III subunit delta' [Myxococcota bacterium]